MHSAIRSDYHSFGKTVSSEELRDNSNGKDGTTHRLSALETYPALCDVADKCGLKIESVRVEALSFGENLKHQMDSDQQKSAELRAQMIQKKEQRKLHEIQIEDRRKQIEQEEELNRLQAESNARMQKEHFVLKEAELTRQLALDKRELIAKFEVDDMCDERAISFLKELREEGVDINQFLCSVGSGVVLATPALSKSKKLGSCLTPKEYVEKHIRS